MATSKSWLMPIESSRRWEAGTPLSMQPIAVVAQLTEPNSSVLRVVGKRRQKHEAHHVSGGAVLCLRENGGKGVDGRAKFRGFEGEIDLDEDVDRSIWRRPRRRRDA